MYTTTDYYIPATQDHVVLDNGDLVVRGWYQDILLKKREVALYQEALLNLPFDTYTTDDGVTTLQGQSLSYVVDNMRHTIVQAPDGKAQLKIRMPGKYSAQIKLIKALGFSVVRARGKRVYGGGKQGWGVTCDCVTL